MLVHLQALYGGRIYPHHHTDGGRKPHFMWMVVSRQAEAVLRAVRPYLVQKREQADIALEYREQGIGKGKFEIAADYRRSLSNAKSV